MVSKVHGYAVAGTKRPTPGSRRTVGRGWRSHRATDWQSLEEDLDGPVW